MSDNVNHPAHYNLGDIECIDAIKAATGDQFCGYLQGNAIKYIYRHAYKDNPVQDLEKAIWYIKKLIEERALEQIKKPFDGNKRVVDEPTYHPSKSLWRAKK